ncbi:DUF4132 domain-containing protein [Pseudoalteromonas piratica]|uniref:DUF4132 domain-containing protein n=1 Tax=Pseudoalteromonas piratica TaxID=1348114 RepID=A0A0A7EBN8_9GAMM|nr:DUF4132 domain-containing protein [Pseudoalteromonas piratica]AIY63918.1 hypothetical protein OM33_01155 [Pseudoalteromonas piratica]
MDHQQNLSAISELYQHVGISFTEDETIALEKHLANGGGSYLVNEKGSELASIAHDIKSTLQQKVRDLISQIDHLNSSYVLLLSGFFEHIDWYQLEAPTSAKLHDVKCYYRDDIDIVKIESYLLSLTDRDEFLQKLYYITIGYSHSRWINRKSIPPKQSNIEKVDLLHLNLIEKRRDFYFVGERDVARVSWSKLTDVVKEIHSVPLLSKLLSAPSFSLAIHVLERLERVMRDTHYHDYEIAKPAIHNVADENMARFVKMRFKFNDVELTQKMVDYGSDKSIEIALNNCERWPEDEYKQIIKACLTANPSQVVKICKEEGLFACLGKSYIDFLWQDKSLHEPLMECALYLETESEHYRYYDDDEEGKFGEEDASGLGRVILKMITEYPEKLAQVKPGGLVYIIVKLANLSQFKAILPYILPAINKSTRAQKSIAKRLAREDISELVALGWIDAKLKGHRQAAFYTLKYMATPDTVPYLKLLLQNKKISQTEVAAVKALLGELGEIDEDTQVELADTSKYKVKKPELIAELVTDEFQLLFGEGRESDLAWLIDKSSSFKKPPLAQYLIDMVHSVTPVNRAKIAHYLINTWDCRQEYDDELLSAKRKNYDFITVLVGYFADDSLVPEFEKQINKWKKINYHSSIRIIRALGTINTTYSLAALHEISTKSSYSDALANAAIDILAETAKLRGIGYRDLTDLLVPDFGLTKQGITLPVGDKDYVVTLNGDFTLRVTNSLTNRVTKSLPKAGSNEDPELRASAEQTFKTLRTNIKKVAKKQAPRMVSAFYAARCWTKDYWQQLFIDHSLMNILAQAFVWQDADSLKSFRISEDGSLIDYEDEVVVLADESQIRLFHPVFADTTEIEQWQAHLDDYELSPLIEQFDRVNSLPELAEIESDFAHNSIDVSVGDVNSIAKKWNMPINQEGSYYSDFSYTSALLNHVLEFGFDSYRPGDYFDDIITVTEIRIWNRETYKNDIANAPKPLIAMAYEIKKALQEKSKVSEEVTA